MGGIKDALFGSDGEPAQVVDTLPDAFARLQNPVSNAVEGIIQRGGTPTPSGPLAAPLGAQERELIDAIIARAQGPGQGAAASRDFYTGALANPSGGRTPEEAAALSRLGATGLDPSVTSAGTDLARRILSGELLRPESNPFLQANIESAQRPIIEAFKEIALPRLQGDFARAGHFTQPTGSSPFDRAAALATTGVTNQLADIATSLTAANFDAERNRQLEALRTVDQAANSEASRANTAFSAASQAGAEDRRREELAADRLPALDEAEINNLITAVQTAALPRLIEDLGVERGLQVFRERINGLLEALRVGGSVSSPRPAVLPGTEGSSGLIGGLAGGFGSAAGTAAGAALFG